jgi:hypothetical protein
MMNDKIRALKDIFVGAATQAQEHYGNDKEAVVVVMNALVDATVEYIVRSTGPTKKNAQKRYDELVDPVMKAIQEFMTKYTGACAIIDPPPEKKGGKDE